MQDTLKLIEIHSATPDWKEKYMGKVREFQSAEAAGDAALAIAKLREAHEMGCKYFNFYEDLAGYSDSLAPSAGWLSKLADDCIEILKSRINHEDFLMQSAARLGISGDEFRPGDLAYKRMQILVAQHHPSRVPQLRQDFMKRELPTAGFDVPLPSPSPKANNAQEIPSPPSLSASIKFGSDGTLQEATGLESGHARDVLLKNARIDLPEGRAAGAVGGDGAPEVIRAIKPGKPPDKKLNFWEESLAELKKQPVKIAGVAVAALLAAWLGYLGISKRFFPQTAPGSASESAPVPLKK